MYLAYEKNIPPSLYKQQNARDMNIIFKIKEVINIRSNQLGELEALHQQLINRY